MKIDIVLAYAGGVLTLLAGRFISAIPSLIRGFRYEREYSRQYCLLQAELDALPGPEFRAFRARWIEEPDLRRFGEIYGAYFWDKWQRKHPHPGI